MCYGSIHCGVGLWRVPFIIILLLSLFSVIVCPSSSAPRFFALRPSVLLAVSPIFGRNRVNTVCFPSKKYSSIFRCLPTHRSRTASAAHEIWELIAWVSFSCLCKLLRDFISYQLRVRRNGFVLFKCCQQLRVFLALIRIACGGQTSTIHK